MSDTELVKRAQEGHQDALIQLLREIESPLYRTAYYMLGHEQDALDMTQEALIRIYKNINRFEQKAQFKTWAQRIVTNLCIDYCRQKKTVISTDQHEHLLRQHHYHHVERELEQSILKGEIEQAINQLNEQQRAVVILRYLQDFSYQEIADALDLPINTVKSHLFRARKELQRALFPEEENDELKGGV
ncbi:RNA polymerase sigma-70 factor (ECF subfamily) [Caldalkalibacillus uzonensis]|uniref:RNA polymerase sigma-70 factor (ECF subfamily) n=1 Tax=Caldalkalibacillus uzonensis TaxID=353224 RepID=A0ABU0CUK9_9BACI|nr:RNA polymerase sigma factor [Caldalkalibacillus uzonensis]MDQ0339601.1 RNA polymerase sigma-70 factor (ECF subfamily) [Caldalkalibacillus uzonensis]